MIGFRPVAIRRERAVVDLLVWDIIVLTVPAHAQDVKQFFVLERNPLSDPFFYCLLCIVLKSLSGSVEAHLLGLGFDATEKTFLGVIAFHSVI